MAKELVYIDAAGDKKPLDLSLGMYESAAAAGQTLPQHMASVYPTNAEKHGSAFEQVLEQVGVFVKGNQAYGIRPSTMEDLLATKEAASVTKEGVPVSRLLFPAVILGVIEDKLQVDLTTNLNGLSSLIAMDDSIAGDRWERPVLNFSKPEKARNAPIAQLALPSAMLTITASDKSMRIPSWGIGMEISEQAMRATTLDLVGLAIARQAAVEANERANGYILTFLQGDVDYGMVALSSISGKVVAASSLDAAATGGVLTQKAWLKWLVTNSNKRTILKVVTDLAGALAIENRVGKPVITNDNPNSPRIDTLSSVVNPKWPTNVQIFLSDDPLWPAGTIMGIDTRYGVHRVKSLTAQYSAIEQFALKRSTALRIDNGEILYRLFDEAFEVLTLT